MFGFAKQSGGDLDVASELGDGTTFTLYLPEVEAPAEGTAVQDHENWAIDGAGARCWWSRTTSRSGASPRRSCTISATRPSGRLTPRRRWIAWAGTATASTRCLGRGDAGMGGIALAEELRRRLPDLPVVLASGYSHVLAEEGCHGFELLHKPYSADQLSRMLRRVIARAA